jgi:hypothetical protein
MMHDLMAGMFWGGVVMALPPVTLGVAILVFVIRHRLRAAERTRAAGE